ncbi:hypothetical protein Tco_1540424 [Tanacetum coccineum]
MDDVYPQYNEVIAFAELLDNSLDQVRTGATYVKVDVMKKILAFHNVVKSAVEGATYLKKAKEQEESTS